MRGARFPIAAILVSGAVATASFLISLPSSYEHGAETAANDVAYAPGSGLTPPSITESESVTVGASASAAIIPNAIDAPIEKTPAPPYERTLTIGKGDTLMAMLTDAGIKRGDAYEAITALSKIYSPRRLLPGQEVTLTFHPDPEGKEDDRFAALTLATAVDREVHVTETDKGAFKANEIEKPLLRSVHRNQGDIQSSLYVAAMRANLPEAVLMELIRAYSWDVDFQRDIQPGDAFEVMYERLDTEEGELARYGDVLYAALTLSGKHYPIYLHTTRDGTTDYFDDKGRSAKKALMRTPINGAKLSSRYGKRMHPILGYTKMHKGVDFAAPPGTPILAAGDGVIDHAGTNGAYGKYVRIR
ncbi:MAG: peptidoglycan DD-metalloendopeptidase family protein, partial [Rhodospirillales bacterium]|nr:peptidoglycan DD-metalloendopeptidase family protein [Rhodospirillales bacterium]